MRKLLSIFAVLVLSLSAFAQCDPAGIKDMPSAYKKGYETSYKPTSEQEKWMTSIFTSVAEPALKSTKGLRGTWDPMGGFPLTPEGFIKSEIESYMFTLGCKDNKLYTKDEQGLILNFDVNGGYPSEHGEIMNVCRHEETKYKKFDDSKTLYVNDLFDGRQIYYLQQPTATKDYPNVAFYRKTSEGEYFIITKPGVPLFIPLTTRQVLEINRKNYTSLLEEEKKHALMPGLQPETRADYEKRMAKDFAAYRQTMPTPEQFITDLIKQLEDQKPALIKQQQFFINFYTKNIALVTDYLKITPAKELDKSCISASGLMISAFGDKSDIGSIQSYFTDVESRGFGSYVTLNPAYFNKTISKTAPQFMSIQLEIQGGSAIALKAYNDFKANLDLNKLQSLLVE
jgi:hypothetical protein